MISCVSATSYEEELKMAAIISCDMTHQKNINKIHDDIWRIINYRNAYYSI
jgi:hypothetical protein